MPFDFFSDTLNKHHFKMAHFTETKKKKEKEINWCVPTKWVIIYESTFLFKSRKMEKWLQHTKMASNEEKRRVPLTMSTLTKAFLPRVEKRLCDFDQKALTLIELWDYYVTNSLYCNPNYHVLEPVDRIMSANKSICCINLSHIPRQFRIYN